MNAVDENPEEALLRTFFQCKHLNIFMNSKTSWRYIVMVTLLWVLSRQPNLNTMTLKTSASRQEMKRRKRVSNKKRSRTILTTSSQRTSMIVWIKASHITRWYRTDHQHPSLGRSLSVKEVKPTSPEVSFIFVSFLHIL